MLKKKLNGLRSNTLQKTVNSTSENETNKIHTIFNKISDIKNKNEIILAFKQIDNIPERIHLVDKIIKRKEEIIKSNELAQINKLSPLFSKLKQNFLKKLRMRKSDEFQKQNINRIPMQKQCSFSKKEIKKKNILQHMIASLNDHGYERQKAFSSVEKEKPEIVLNFEKNIKKKPNKILCKFSSLLNQNNKYLNILENDLYIFGSKNNTNIFLNNSVCKSINQLENRIKDKLIKVKNDKKKTFSFQLNNNDSTNLIQKNISQNNKKNNIKTRNNKEKIVNISIDNQDNSDSFVSFTESKLNNLYKESKKLNNERNNLKYLSHDFNDKVKEISLIKSLDENYNEIIRTVKGKLQSKNVK